MTYVLCLLVAVAGGIALMQWRWPSPFSIVFLTVMAAFLLAPLGPLVFALTLPLRITALPRPLMDILIWMLSFVVLMLLFWGPTMTGFADVSDAPLTLESVVIPAISGGIGGWLYWLFAGRPAPQSL